MSDENDVQVTYVGGRAVEQTEGLESTLETDEREAAKAAVKKAIDDAKAKEPKPEGDEDESPKVRAKPKASEKVSAGKEEKGGSEPAGERQRGPDGKFLPKTGKSDDEDGDSDSEDSSEDSDDSEDLDIAKASVKQLLKAREKVAQVKKEAQQYTKQQQEFQRQQQEFYRQQTEFQRQQQELARQQQYFAMLRKDPARAVRELGFEPEQFVLDLATEGTPEGQYRRKQQEIDQQLSELRQWKEAQARQAEEYQRRVQAEQVVAHREASVRTFLERGMSEDKYPHIANFYQGNEQALVAFGDNVWAQFYELSGGRQADFDDVLDYIEDHLASKTKSWYTKNSQAQKKPKPEEESFTKPKSKGKSLSPDASGERGRARAKDVKDMDDDERIEAAKQATKVALANSK